MAATRNHSMAWRRALLGMGYLRGLRHGAIAGAVLGLLYAPESGVAMRRRLSRLLGQAQAMMAGDSGGAPVIAATTPRRRAAGGPESRAKRP
ncbi:MAG: YtxH domain-containing protein [Chloroflexi bacterium]|nr:MAG: YtxH domain-containing protein [Chloroflexota bacterium]